MVHDNFGVAAEEAAADEEAGADIRIADARLSRIPSLARQALLLTAVEGFSEQETGRIIGRDVDEVYRLIGEATEEIDRQRSEEHTSELQSLMRISYAAFCLKKKSRRYT